MTENSEASPCNIYCNQVKVALITALGNFVGDLILYPLDTISTRLKGDKHLHNKAFPYLWNSLKTERWKLYKGVSLSFPASFIPTAIYVGIY
jgi:hypothetical protein